MTVLLASRVVTPAGMLAPGRVAVENDRIVSVDAAAEPAPAGTLVPGFVDLQVNGHGDVDVATATVADWDRLDQLLLAQGVTTWCPTLVSAPLDRYAGPLARVAEAAARAGPRPAIAGAHLEGPFLGSRPGAHRPDLVRPPDLGWLADLPDVVRLVTLGPEADAAVEAVELLAQRGVTVALGHSAATFEQAQAAVEAGARLVTHCFNGMAPFHHRQPGVLGAALSDDRLAVSLIADLVHVHPAALRLAFRAKGRGRVALVTDAVAWSGDGVPRLADGTLAGSTLTMDRAVANVVAHAGVPLPEAVAAAATTPADLLGLGDRGRIEPGARADLVLLDDALRPRTVWVGGVPVVGGGGGRSSTRG